MKNVQDLYRLSPMQREMLLYSLYAPTEGANVEQVYWTWRGPLDLMALQRAWQRVIERHPILRTAFFWEGMAEPVQAVRQTVEVRIEQLDWQGLPAGEEETQLAQYLEAVRREGIHLSQAPLMRLGVLQVAPEVYRCTWSYHHVLLDGWSAPVCLREVLLLYQAFCRGQEIELETPRPYREYIQWLGRQNLAEARRYWQETLAGFDTGTPLFLAGPTTVASGDERRYLRRELQLSAAATAELQARVRQHRLTLNTLIQGAWAVLLSRYSGEEDVIFGATVSGRPPALPGVDTMVGLFINTLPVRVRVSPEVEIGAFLQALQADQFAARRYDYLPLLEIRSLGEVGVRQRLFDSVLVVENLPERHLAQRLETGAEMCDVGRTEARTGFPLTFMVLPGTELVVQCIFDEALFPAAAIERMLAALGQLLEGLLADPARRLREVSVLTAAERKALLGLGNAAGEGGPGPAVCIHERIAAQAAKTPDALAVVQGSRQLTYRALDADATRLGQRLRSLGVGLGARVGLCLERSPDVLVAMLGVLKAGGAYVPLDPASPKERLAFILEQAEVRVLLTEACRSTSLPEVSIPVLFLDGPGEADPAAGALEAVPPEAAAYVIYTSGSTGAPKGVVVEHHALTRIATGLAGQFALGPGDRVLQFTSLVWDTCGEEIYPCLLAGACLVLRTEAMLDPLALLKACDDLGVTVADWPTAYWHEVVEILESERLPLPPGLRLLIIGGEAASPEKLGRWFARVGARPRLLNTFGPTETTIVATCAELTCAPAPGRPVPIGRPLPRVETYVLDRAGQLAPLGVPGELFIGGVGVARGYLGEPHATAERFLPHEFGGGPGARWYRTGDLVRYRHDGVLEFLGRCDRQIKIRGIRIEPGEIERTLGQHPGVKDVVVLAPEDERGQRHLVAYVVPRGEPVAPAELRAFVGQTLPDVMVPASFVMLGALPRTARDKLDLAALPAPQAPGRDERLQVPPRGPIEEMLARVFGDVLKLEGLGAHDSFFELGGNSLMAMQVVSRVRRDFGVELPLRALFASPTVAATAAEIERARADKTQPAPPLGPVARAGRLPLSFAQQRLWFLEQLVPGSPLYNIVVGMRIQGPIDVAAFERSLQEVGRRHETLRTTFAASDGQPYQRIAAEMTLPCRVVDLRDESEAEVRRLAMEEAQRPFDLAAGPLLRTLLLRLEAEEHVLVLSMHHIVSDGWSMGVLVQELAALYESFSRAGTVELPPLPIQYVDYAVWQREWLAGERLERQLGYWKRQLAGVAPLELPTDMPRPRLQSDRGAVVPVAYPRALRDGLVRLGQKEGATLFMVLLGAFELLLSRYARQSDVAVGTPIAGRTRTEVEGLVGLFVNTLVLRTDLSGNLNFKQLLSRVKEVTLEGYAHQDVPFEKVVEALAPARQLDRTPLFQVVFVLQNAPVPEIRREELRLLPLPLDTGTAKFDLTLSLEETAEGLCGMLEYNTDLFAAETVARMAGHLGTLLAAIVAAPERAIHDLPLLTEAEQHTLLVEWARPGAESAHGACVHELFEAQAARTPNALAVASDAGFATYGELDARANQLARALRQRGVGPEVPVAIFLERSPEMVLGILAVLKAGGAYVPLDPAHPAERLAFVLGDAQARVLLTVEPLAASLPVGPWQIVRLDADWDAIAQSSPERLPPCVAPDHLAYVIYTSGSTGRPKGTAITHRALLHLVSWHRRAFDVSAKDKAALIAGPAFDASVWETWPYLVAGASLHAPDEETRALPESLRDWLVGRGITLCFVPTPLAEQLVLLSWPAHTALRRMLTGGDRLRQWPPSGLPFELFNNYGPTENTVVATSGLVPPAARSVRAPDLGRPLDHVEVYVLDPRLQPVPIGVPGEIYLGGEGLGRGYWRQPGLTAERFVPHPFAGRSEGARLYRTGDLARWLPGGCLEFLGRMDFQVKVRGFRIELGEIEQVLVRHPRVREAVVIAHENVLGGRRLVAYVVPRGEGEAMVGEPTAGELREHLRRQLPEYMVPAVLVSLAALPLSPNGKVDRQALPAPQAEVGEAGVIEEPRNEMEAQLAQLFAEVLQRPRVGIRDDFFALGGHSLLATQLVARIHKTLQVELPLRALFDAPTVAGLVERVSALQGQSRARELPLVPVPRPPWAELPLSFAQQRLWFLDRLEPGSSTYNMPFVLRLLGRLEAEPLRQALTELVRRHEVLRTTFAMGGGGEPVQRIAEPRPWMLPLRDLSSLAETEREAEARRLAAEEARRPFDLEAGPLLRTLLLRLDEREHVLVLNMHHIVSDGWSMGVLLRELAALYESLSGGRTVELPPLPVQYADYAVWQREWLQGERLEGSLEYWRRQLAGVAPLGLPTDFSRPRLPSYRGAVVPVAYPRALQDGLVRLGQKEGATLFMVLLGAFQLLLSRYARQSDVAVGTPVAGRTRTELEGLVGFFVNTLVLRTDLSGNPSFVELLGRVREVTLEGYAHQEVPFEKVVEALSPARQLDRTPLFEVLFVLQNAPMPEIRREELRLVPVGVDSGTAKFDLTLSLEETAEGLRGTLEYGTDLFAEETARRMVGHLEVLLQGIVAAPERRVAELPLLTAEEQRRLLVGWNDTGVEVVGEVSLHELVEAQVERTPDAVALVAGTRRMRYREVAEQARVLAWHLRELGVGPETRVAVCLERSAELVIALLGVLGAGGAYVPLDPAYPVDRLRFMLEDSAAEVVITQRKLQPLLAGARAPQVLLDEPLVGASQPGRLPGGSGRGHLAYVLYTSGSTGRPKGVALEHRSAVAFVRWAMETFSPEQLRGVLAATSVCFDLSVFELFVPLCSGGTVIMAENALGLGELPARDEVTLVNTVPSAMAELVRLGAVPSSVRTINLAGEALSGTLVESLYGLGSVQEVLNLYGPTEDTTYSTWTEVPRQLTGAPTIGRPLRGTQAYVLDGGMSPVPIGVPGELYLGGAGLGRGYLGRPDLTAERFVPSPHGPPGARLYRTGDLVRYRDNGELEYLGRIDHQIKLRGFRIELGEIEEALRRHPQVREAVVVAREDVPGDKRLVAYVVPQGEGELAVGELREHLRRQLPEYMVPAALVRLAALPLSPNGKVDRQALPAPQAEVGEAGVIEEPRNEMEAQLAQLFAEVLHRPRVGIRDDFFALGGHSLLATQLVARIHKTLQVELPLRALFDAPTVAGLVERVSALQGQSRARELPLVPVPRPPWAELPLSFAQQRLWFLDRLEPGSSTYNMPFVLRLLGRLEAEPLRQALTELVRRHEVLRTTFAMGGGGEPVQRIAEPRPWMLPLRELSSLAETEREAEARRLAMEEARRPFDLEAGPLLRTLLLRLDEREHVLVLNMHHIVSDGWSMGVLLRELAALYESLSGGRTVELPPLPVQYADYAVWQREWLQGERLEGSLEYWKRQLAGIAPLGLPTDFSRPRLPSYRGAVVPVAYPRALQDGLVRLGQKEGATLFMVLLGAFQLLLSRYARQSDVAVGTPVAGRTRTELEGLVGFFVNTLVLRTDLSGNPSFVELLGRVREVTLEGYAHQEVPFEKVVEALSPARQLDRPPLFEVLFVLQNAPMPEIRREELRLVPVGVDSGTAKFDLTLSLEETAEGLRGTLEYGTDLFAEETVRRMVGHLEVLLQGIVAAPERRVAELPLLTAEEQRRLLVGWNDTGVEVVGEACLHELVEAQVERTPDAVALVAGTRRMRYRELAEQARILAWHLRELGVGPETRVAVCLERSAELVIALLGVLGAGGAYVPLDPAYPVDRLRFMLEDSAAEVVITQRKLQPLLAGARAPQVLLDEPLVGASQPGRLPGGSGRGHLAYVLYTSGSTGRPKGVALEHRSAVAFVRWAMETFSPEQLRGVLAATSVCFDLSVFELFVPLCSGGTVIMAENALGLGELPARDEVTLVNTVPSAMAELVRLGAVPSSVRTINLAGEALSGTLVESLYGLGSVQEVLNLYGPTEDTTYSTWTEVPRQLTGAPTIGRPLRGTQAYVLDAVMSPVPIGVPGELYLGGAGLGRGYLGRPDLTAERFVPSPHGPPGARLYRTGDLVRYRDDGELEYLGRIDHQIKLRGFRIELGEIEEALRRHPQVREAVVVAREDVPGDKRLVAYVVPRGEEALAVGELREHLRRQLPEYMVPAVLVSLAALPLSPNGKVDRQALPAPQGVLAAGAEFLAPRDRIELLLAQLWEQVLRVHPIGVRQNFFALGGHSLLAVGLMAQIERLFGRKLPLATLFTHATVEDLAALLREDQRGRSGSPVIPIQPRGERRPLFLVHPIGGTVLCYASLARHLGTDQPLYGLEAAGLDGASEPCADLTAMATRYVAAMHEVQAEGPYCLGGWSMGGVVAFEMARQIVAAGEAVELVVLIDSWAPAVAGGPVLPTTDEVTLLVEFAADLGRIVHGGRPVALLREELVPLDSAARLRMLLERGHHAGVLPAHVAVDEVRALLGVFRAHLGALARYRPEGEYPGRVALVYPSASDPADPAGGWTQVTRQAPELYRVPGDHYSLLAEPHVVELAAGLRHLLDEPQHVTEHEGAART